MYCVLGDTEQRIPNSDFGLLGWVGEGFTEGVKLMTILQAIWLVSCHIYFIFLFVMVNFMCQLHRITNAHIFWLNIIFGCVCGDGYRWNTHLQYIYLAALGLSFSVWDLWSSLLLGKSLVVTCGIQFSDQGWNLGPLYWKHRVLAPGPRFVLPDLEGHRPVCWVWIKQRG